MKSGGESGHIPILTWCCTVSKSIGNQVGANTTVIHKEVMEMTLKPDSLMHCTSPLVVSYPSQKYLNLLAPTPYANVTRLSPTFRVRVWLCETRQNTPDGLILM